MAFPVSQGFATGAANFPKLPAKWRRVRAPLPLTGPSKRVLPVCPIPLRTGMRRREEMKTLARWMVCICLLVGAGGRLSAQESAAPAGQSEDKTPTSYDMKAQAALDLQELQQKFTSLAQAIPQRQ